MIKNFLLIVVLITVDTLFSMNQGNDKPDTGFEIRQLVLHHGGEFEGKTLRNLLRVDKQWNELIKQRVKKKCEKCKKRDMAVREFVGYRCLELILGRKKRFAGKVIYLFTDDKWKNIIFNGYHKHLFVEKYGYHKPLFREYDPFVEEDRISFYGKYNNSMTSYITKHSWSLLGQGQQRCEMAYKGQQYQLSAYKDFPVLMRAILASTKVNYIGATKEQVPVLEYDLSGVEIPESYGGYNLNYSSFLFNEQLKDEYKKLIIERYEEQKLEKK